MKYLVVIGFCVTVSACGLFDRTSFGQTEAEFLAGYTYAPIEPSGVTVTCRNSTTPKDPCFAYKPADVIAELPDNSVRIATRDLTGSAGIGTIATVKGSRYEVTIDFVNTRTFNQPFLGKWRIDHISSSTSNRLYPQEQPIMGRRPPREGEIWRLDAQALKIDEAFSLYGIANSSYLIREIEQQASFDQSSLVHDILRSVDALDQKGAAIPTSANPPNSSAVLNMSYITRAFERCKNRVLEASGLQADQRTRSQIVREECSALLNNLVDYEVFNVPVYAGYGIRLKAEVTALKAGLKFVSFADLAAAADAGEISGTMSVQTLGIINRGTADLQLYDSISEDNIKSAIQSLSAIKARLYQADTKLTPRILGFHNTVGAEALGINLIHTQLVSDDSFFSFAVGGRCDCNEPD